MKAHPLERFLLQGIAEDARQYEAEAPARAAREQSRQEEAAIDEASRRAHLDWLREFHARNSPTFEAHLAEARRTHGLT